ncbi:YcbK family protein [Polyangium jinanense]|uniref:Murein endopeptidase K n=1 Tax=Polyangium jinanense TaxID=2829994 RepID=A0A9X3WXL3_9BACT|nr:DUF882 domain-containing protein [Polyangium jinanense]MDC3953804.1 DUF882 domain-containing protein [Polyangium jinanense]MDC3979075.1 DUF882 domain-containing protein [Polyangium jinanense]
MKSRAIPALVAAAFALPVPSPLSEAPLPPPRRSTAASVIDAAAALAPSSDPSPADPAANAAHAKKPLATIVHGHTQETLALTEDEPTIERFSTFLADHGYEQETRIDPRLLDLLRTIAKKHEGTRIEIVSGYRSPKRNEVMRKKGRHVASHSQHTLGMAIDFRVDGLSVPELAAEILQAKWQGGLGTYAGRRDRFVHVDTGPKRRWSGF